MARVKASIDASSAVELADGPVDASSADAEGAVQETFVDPGELDNESAELADDEDARWAPPPDDHDRLEHIRVHVKRGTKRFKMVEVPTGAGWTGDPVTDSSWSPPAPDEPSSEGPDG